MMRSKKMNTLTGMLGMLGVIGYYDTYYDKVYDDVVSADRAKRRAQVDERTRAESAEILRKKQLKLLIDKGVNEYRYGENRVVFARNKKNADKKAKKQGWL